jgi:mono/diheme cytochrome c family protein
VGRVFHETRMRSAARIGAVAVALIGGAAFAGGCDSSEDADTVRGRALFQAKCGTCHALAEAGTSATVGPDLDASFAQARADGMDSDTVEGVVQGQIANPRTIEANAENYDQVYMPADLVVGQDAEDVATYVASVAGVPGAKPPPLGDAEDIFAEKCAQCHGLEPGTGSGVGPNLGDSLKGKDEKYTLQQIVDPETDIVSGFPSGVMPQDFEEQIPMDKLNELVQFLLQNANGGG